MQDAINWLEQFGTITAVSRAKDIAFGTLKNRIIQAERKWLQADCAPRGNQAGHASTPWSRPHGHS
jgi:hypothetical protein